jgi:hypothetical protein
VNNVESEVLMHVKTIQSSPQAKMMVALSLRKRIMTDVNGFGMRRVRLAASLESCQWHIHDVGIGRRRYFGGVTDPFPTMLRAVSGRKHSMTEEQRPEAMARNQKIQVQPAA